MTFGHPHELARFRRAIPASSFYPPPLPASPTLSPEKTGFLLEGRRKKNNASKRREK
jgi:hypothetical protein